jgi:energy-coupling factor transporter transmembrane protein EcfT
MKILKFVMYLFYRYYNKGGTRRIPYFSALCAVVFLIYIHIFQLLIILDRVSLLPMKKDDLRIEKYGKVALFLLPIFLIVAFLVKPSELKALNYSDETVEKGNVNLVIYIISTILLLFTLMILFSKI